MKRAFILTEDYGLASALVSDETRDVLNLGSRITITRPLDLGYDALIESGEQGTVDHIDPVSGMVEVLLDLIHRGLAAWDNHMWLEPFGTDDIIDGVACTVSCISVVHRLAAY